MPRNAARKTEWTREWFAQRRASGRCPQCPDGRLTINPRTGDYYHRCRSCRLVFATYLRRRYRAKVDALTPPAETGRPTSQNSGPT